METSFTFLAPVFIVVSDRPVRACGFATGGEPFRCRADRPPSPERWKCIRDTVILPPSFRFRTPAERVCEGSCLKLEILRVLGATFRAENGERRTRRTRRRDENKHFFRSVLVGRERRASSTVVRFDAGGANTWLGMRATFPLFIVSRCLCFTRPTRNPRV